MSETAVAYCGINCDKCPVFIATFEDDESLRQKTAKEWSNLYGKILESFGIHSLKPEDINCYGCRSERGIFIGCASCSIRTCCQDKGLITCADCDEYDSCDMLKGFYSLEIHQNAKENLDRLRMKR
jgi:hypothetical protein